MPKLMDEVDFSKGHIPCGKCEEFTYIFRASVIRTLPDGYHGEACPQCGDWMCRIDKIGKKDGEK